MSPSIEKVISFNKGDCIVWTVEITWNKLIVNSYSDICMYMRSYINVYMAHDNLKCVWFKLYAIRGSFIQGCQRAL